MYTEYLGPIDEKLLDKNEPRLQQAARLIQQGGLVAVPTETTYGLAASIVNEKALQDLYKVKNRLTSSPLPIQVSNFGQLKFLTAPLPDSFHLLAKHFLPGPLTLIVKKSPQFSSILTGKHDSIGVRLSSCKITTRLIELVGCPLAMPSANLSGYPSPTSAKHVLQDFNGKINGILDGGDTQWGLETTVLSLEDPEHPLLLRFGVIKKQDIEKVLGKMVRVHPHALIHQSQSQAKNKMPPLRLFSSIDEIKIYLQLSNRAKRLLVSDAVKPLPSHLCHSFKLKPNNLYEALRFALQSGIAEILVLSTPTLKKNEALYHRLKQLASS